MSALSARRARSTQRTPGLRLLGFSASRQTLPAKAPPFQWSTTSLTSKSRNIHHALLYSARTRTRLTALLPCPTCRKNVSKAWARKQVRPYPAPSGGTWTGEVFVGQCFYGFPALELENAGKAATFGGFLPDDAIIAVEDWLQLHNYEAQVTLVCNMYFDYLRLTALSASYILCRMHLGRPQHQGGLQPQAKLLIQGRKPEKSRRPADCAMQVSNCSGSNRKLDLYSCSHLSIYVPVDSTVGLLTGKCNEFGRPKKGLFL